MGGVWYRARADLRRRVWGTVALVALVGLAGGVTLAAVAASVRTRDALPEFVAYNQPPETAVYVDGRLPPDEQAALVRQVIELPDWDGAAHVQSAMVSVQPPDGDETMMLALAIRDAAYPLEVSRPLLVAGHPPDPTSPTDAVVNEAFAEVFGLQPGDEFDLRSITADQADAAVNGDLVSDPGGTAFSMTVAGIERQPRDLRAVAPQDGTDTSPLDAASLTLTPAWWQATNGDVASYGGGVFGHLHDGVSIDDLTAAVAEIDADSFFVAPANDDTQVLASIGRATDFEAGALLVFAAVMAIAGVALAGQAIGRQITVRLDDSDALRAAGLTRRERTAVLLPRSVLLGLGGAVVAAGVAVAVSPLSPVGVARRAELHPGLDLDPAVILGGAAAIATLVVAWSAIVAWRATRVTGGEGLVRRNRPSAAGAWLANAGAGMTTVAGVRLALERGRGRTAVPVISTLLAGTGGVLMVTAVLTFSLSLTHLVDTPALQGWTWDVSVGNYDNQDGVDLGRRDLQANPLVDAYLGLNVQPLSIDATASNVASIGPGDPSVGPPVLTGRLPAAEDEIALGRRTLGALHKTVGDTVTLRAESGGAGIEATVVGTVVLPASEFDTLTLGDGGLMTLAGLRAAYGSEGADTVAQTFLVRFADGVGNRRGVSGLRDDFGDNIVTAARPDDIKNLKRVQGLPVLLAVTVGALALGTLANALVTCIRRRRRDLATFATLGFRPRQIAATVAWQATTIAVLALGVGVPLGIAAGRTVWQLVMTSIGTSVAPVTPWAALGLLALVVFVGANGIAVLPARAASRVHPAATLRSE